MGKHTEQFLGSFTQWKVLVLGFLHDATFLGIFFGIATWFVRSLERRSAELFAGQTPEQIQQYLLSAPDQAAPFVANLQGFLAVLLIGGIGLLLLSWLGWSFSRMHLWNTLEGKLGSFRPFWKWVLLHLALLIPLIGLGVAYLLVKLIVSLILRAIFTAPDIFYFTHQTGVDKALLFISSLVSVFLTLWVLFYLFAVYDSFVKKKKAWASIGTGFQAFKRYWKSLWRGILFATAVALVILLILLPIQQALFIHPKWLAAIQLIVGLAYVAWVRQYFLSFFHGSH